MEIKSIFCPKYDYIRLENNISCVLQNGRGVLQTDFEKTYVMSQKAPLSRHSCMVVTWALAAEFYKRWVERNFPQENGELSKKLESFSLNDISEIDENFLKNNYKNLELKCTSFNDIKNCCEMIFSEKSVLIHIFN